jgi:hypothetical protein
VSEREIDREKDDDFLALVASVVPSVATVGVRVCVRMCVRIDR